MLMTKYSDFGGRKKKSDSDFVVIQPNVKF